MNPYEIDIDKLKESKKIQNQMELFKLGLIVEFLKATSKMSTQEILDVTHLHKSDLSRLRSLSVARFSTDRIVGILDSLGFSVAADVRRRVG